MNINLPKPGDSLPFVVAEWKKPSRQYRLMYDRDGLPVLQTKSPGTRHEWREITPNASLMMELVGGTWKVRVAEPTVAGGLTPKGLGELNTVAPTEGGGE